MRYRTQNDDEFLLIHRYKHLISIKSTPIEVLLLGRLLK